MFVFVCVFVCLRVLEVARQRLAVMGGGELPENGGKVVWEEMSRAAVS